jgi:hypothetical protein
MIAASPTPPSPAHLPAWEKWSVALMLVLFVAICANEIQHLAFVGQDFGFHMGNTNRLLGRPDVWFSHDTTSRPMVYWIALNGISLPGYFAPYAFAASVFTALNTGALLLVHASLRQAVLTPSLRVAALALIAFAPVTLVTTVVFAADGLTMPFFALLCWSLTQWQRAPTLRTSLGPAIIAGLALSVAQFAKFTFTLLPVAVLFLAAWQWRRHPGSARRSLTLVAVAALLPGLCGYWLDREARRTLAAQADWHRFEAAGTGEMTWRSLLLVKPGDARIFSAPTYWDHTTHDGVETWPMLENNGYSYPALLHLSIFTDALDFARGRKTTGHHTPRPDPQQMLSRWSVRSGVVFFLAGIVALCVSWWRIFRSFLKPNTVVREGLVPWAAAAMVWFAPIVLALPFVHHVYDSGYWTPRLIVPALWGFAFGLFVLLDELIGEKPALVRLVVGASLAQAAVMGASVWF